MCNVRLKFKGLSQILGSDNLVLAVLVDVAEQRQLVIPCDRHQAYQIRLRMDPNMIKERNDLLPEVLAELMPFSFLLTYRFEIYALCMKASICHVFVTQRQARRRIYAVRMASCCRSLPEWRFMPIVV